MISVLRLDQRNVSASKFLNVFGKFCSGVLEILSFQSLWVDSVPQADPSGVVATLPPHQGFWGCVPSQTSPPLAEMRCQEGREEPDMNHLCSNRRNELFVLNP